MTGRVPVNGMVELLKSQKQKPVNIKKKNDKTKTIWQS